LNYDDLVEEDDTIDFDEIAKRANPALVSNQEENGQYVGSNYQDFFGDDLDLNSLPKQDVQASQMSNDNTISSTVVVDESEEELTRVKKEKLQNENDDLKIISLPNDEEETGFFDNLNNVSSQNKQEESNHVNQYNNRDIDEYQILNLDDFNQAEENNVNDINSLSELENFDFKKIEEDIKNIDFDMTEGKNEPLQNLKKEDNELEDINLISDTKNIVSQTQSQEDSLLKLMDDLPQSGVEIASSNNDTETSSINNEPKVEELTLTTNVLKNNQNISEKSLENLLSDIVPISELSLKENYDLGDINKNSKIKNKNEPENLANVMKDFDEAPSMSVLDQTLAKMKVGNNLNSLLDESLKDIKDYDLEKLDFHFAHIEKEEDTKKEVEKEEGVERVAKDALVEVVSSAASSSGSVKSQGFTTPSLSNGGNSVTNLVPTVNPNEFPGLSSNRHFDFTENIEDIVIHDEKIRLKKSLGNIFAIILIILFVSALGYIAFKIYNEVKVII